MQTKRAARQQAVQRAGTWSEGRARTLRRRFARQNWRWLASLAAAGAVPSVVIALVFEQGVARGLLLGVALSSVAWAVAGCVFIMSGSTSATFGAWAEQWTAEELAPLTAHGYRLVNHAGLGHGDIDHFLVGPGGVFVLETKWSSHDWKAYDRDPYVQSALEQVQREAERARKWLAAEGVRTVEAVVVLWGGAARALDGVAPSGVRSPQNVLVIAGQDLEAWALSRGRDQLSPVEVDAVADKMSRHVTRRDAVRESAPRSWAEALRTGMLTAVAGVVGLFVPAVLGDAFGSAWTLVSAGVLGLVAFFLRRRGVGLVATGLLGGALTWLALWAAFVITTVAS